MSSKSFIEGNNSSYIYNKSYTFLILLLLLIPLKGFYIYYIFSSILFLAFTFKTPKINNNYLKYVVFFTAFLFLSSSIRFLTSFEINIRDYIETARFIPLIIIFLFISKWKNLKFENFVDAAFMYLLCDGFISYMQLKGLDILGVVDTAEKLYSRERHLENALEIGGRALGLAGGPSQHGAISFLLFTIMLCGVFLLEKRRFLALIGSVLAFLIVLLSQSRTAFVVTSAVCLGILSFFLVSGNKGAKRLAFSLLVIIGLAVGSLISYFFQNYRYLATLFTSNVFEGSSYVVREDKWSEFISATHDQPFWVLIGWGKDFFGEASGAMDSEWVYIYCVYGIIILVIFLFWIVRFFMISTLPLLLGKNSFKNKYIITLFFITLGGLVYAWPSAFFTQPNVLIILGLLIAAMHWEQQRLRMQ